MADVSQDIHALNRARSMTRTRLSLVGVIGFSLSESNCNGGKPVLPAVDYGTDLT
jgi:hypothetical protein